MLPYLGLAILWSITLLYWGELGGGGRAEVTAIKITAWGSWTTSGNMKLTKRSTACLPVVKKIPRLVLKISVEGSKLAPDALVIVYCRKSRKSALSGRGLFWVKQRSRNADERREGVLEPNACWKKTQARSALRVLLIYCSADFFTTADAATPGLCEITRTWWMHYTQAEQAAISGVKK